MIRHKKERRIEMRENIRGGEGTIKMAHLLEKEECFGKVNIAAVLKIKPGESIGLHPHDPDAEIYYILDGKLTVTDNGVESVMKKGDVMITGAGGTHSAKNTGKKTARMLAIVLA